MSDAIIIVPPNSTGAKLDGAQLTVSGQAVFRERIVIASDTDPLARTSPIATDPVGSEYALPVRNIPSGVQEITMSSMPLPTDAATEGTLLAVKAAVEIIDNFISGNRGLVTEDNSAAILAALQGALTVIATNLDIRDLVFATDKVDASGSTVTANAGTNLNTSALALEAGNLATLTAKDFATQTTLALVKAKTDNIPSPGQALMAASTPVAIASNQSAVPISGSVTANAGTNLNTSALALETTAAAGVTALQIIDDWDEANRAAVNLIAGQVGVQGASGAVTALTQRVVLANDVALPTGSNAIGKLAANSGVDIGDVDVASVIPGTAATNLGKAEDAASASADVGVAMLGVRKAAPANTSDADGDYEFLQLSAGRLWVSALLDAALPAGTNNIGDVDVLSLPAIPAGNNNIGDVDVASIAAGNNIIGQVKLSDGTDIADVLDLANANPLTVAIVDGAGDQITSFGGGVEYSEGDTDATIVGKAILWEDAADTLRAVSAAKPLPVNIVAGASSGVQYAEGDTDASITGTAMLMEGAADTLLPVQGTVADGLLVNLGGNNDVTVTGTVTEANSAAIAASLSVLDDWDEANRAAVNTIAGQVGVQGASGAVTALTQRVVLATDVALPTGANVIGQVTANAGTNLNTSALALEAGGNLAASATSLAILDDWDESDRAKVNLIAGQAGIAGGTGVDGATVPRVSLATNVPLPAGDNNIGNVDVVTLPALVAGTAAIGKLTQPSTATLANVGDSATSVTLLAANANRRGAMIYNDSGAILYIKFGATASTSSFTEKLQPEGLYELPEPIYTGLIDGIWASDAGGNARVTELTA